MTTHQHIVGVTLAVLITVFPTQRALGDVSVSFNVISYGPFSVGIDVPIGSILKGASEFFLSLFGGSGNVYDGFRDATGSSPLPPPFVVTIRPEDYLNGRVIRMTYSTIVKDDDLVLACGLSLRIESDGKLRFQRPTFKGYARLDYNGTLSVWNESDTIVLVVTRRDQSTFILQRKSAEGETVINLLFGQCDASQS